MFDSDQLYADACFPKERWTVAGIKLEPFSLGHALILESIDSPFLDLREPEFEDFMFALWICSRRVKPSENTIRLKLPLNWRIASYFLRKLAEKNKARILRSMSALQDYIFESLWFKPPISTRDNKLCRTSTCPSMIPMKRALMSSWGYSEAEVYNMPLRQAKIEQCAWLEHEGALKFTTQSDLDIVNVAMQPENLAWNAKVRADNARKMAAKNPPKKAA